MGRNAFLLWERGDPIRAVGYEIDQDYAAKARRLGIYERVEERDITDGIPEGDGSFDVVVCTDVIGYLDKPDGERALEECERIASERVVISVDVAPGLRDRGHPHELDRSNWTGAELRRRGYEVRAFGSRLSHERHGGRKFLYGFYGGTLLAQVTDRLAEGVVAVKRVGPATD